MKEESFCLLFDVSISTLACTTKGAEKCFYFIYMGRGVILILAGHVGIIPMSAMHFQTQTMIYFDVVARDVGGLTNGMEKTVLWSTSLIALTNLCHTRLMPQPPCLHVSSTNVFAISH